MGISAPVRKAMGEKDRQDVRQRGLPVLPRVEGGFGAGKQKRDGRNHHVGDDFEAASGRDS